MKILKKLIIAVIRIYQVIFSPQTGWFRFLYNSPLTSISTSSCYQGCRYYPTCSEYSKETLRKYPIPIAFKKIINRIKRCHPYSIGGVDPVEQPRKLNLGCDKQAGETSKNFLDHNTNKD